MTAFPVSGRPTELQFYTSLSSVLVQLPVTYLLVGPAQLQTLTPTLLHALALNGLAFHMQSFTAYILMGYISPVTYRWAEMLRGTPLVLCHAGYFWKRTSNSCDLAFLFPWVYVYSK